VTLFDHCISIEAILSYKKEPQANTWGGIRMQESQNQRVF